MNTFILRRMAWVGLLAMTLGACEEEAEFSAITFNAALAPQQQPYEDQRQPRIINALRAQDADVVCLQEVWTDETFDAFVEGLGDVYPHSYRAPTDSPMVADPQCESLEDLDDAMGCIEEKCTPEGISSYDCSMGPCQEEVGALTDKCLYCLSANITTTGSCVFGNSSKLYEGGRHGVALFSKTEMKDTARTQFDAVLFSRVMLSATISGKRIHCIHATAADFELVPRIGRSDTWADELSAEMDVVLSKSKSGDCNLLMGDLNTGISGDGYDGQFEESYNKLVDGGYEDLWKTPACTWCEDNPIANAPVSGTAAASWWIDHIMQKGCTLANPVVTRVLDQPEDLGLVNVTSRLSDHYGLRLDVEAGEE